MGSDFLFARPSHLSGAARTLDLFGLFDAYNVSASPDEADVIALWSDFACIGRDLELATLAYAALEPTATEEVQQGSFVFAQSNEESRRIER